MNAGSCWKFVSAAIVAAIFGSVSAGVYDDVAYWYRGVYNCTAPTIPQLEDWEEFVNALYVSTGEGRGRTTESNSGDRKVQVAGARQNVYADEIMDVPMPYAHRIQKNRSPVHLAQPTYRNPGDDTLYGYSNYVDFTNPFGLANTNAYTLVLRLKHESYTDEATQLAKFVNAGYGWGGNSGFWAALKGDPDNLKIYVYLGSSGSGDFTACQAKDSTRLTTNVWIDVAFVFDPAVGFTVYTCPEGGEICRDFASWKSTLATQNSSWVRLGTGDQNGNSSGANQPVTSTGIKNNFRGWFDQAATWRRALTEAEVREAFYSGFGDGDAIRFGVENDQPWEFKGYNTISGKWVNETSADCYTDWRYFPAMISNANFSARSSGTVTFGPMRAEDYRRPLRFMMKTTSGSAAGAQVTVTLNGQALLTNASAEPGTTLTAPLHYGDVIEPTNTLVIARTDTADGHLLLDCFAIEAVAAAEPTVSDIGKVDDDVWSGAYAWWKGPTDANGDGKFGTSTSTGDRLHNHILNSSAFDGHTTHKWNLDGANCVSITTTSVICPITGEVLNNEPCLYVAPDRWEEEGTGRLRFNRADIFQSMPGVTNSASYAWMIRFKVDEFFDGQKGTEIAGCGYGWSADTGSGVGLGMDANGPDNMYFSLPLGYMSTSTKYPQTLGEEDHIGLGKWIDFGISCSNGTMRVYYAVEGGSGLIEIPYEFTRPAWKAAERSNFVLGLHGTTGTGGAYGTNDQAKVYFHQAAVWPHWLSKKEMEAAFSYPRPNIAQIGIANGNDNEFSGTVPVLDFDNSDKNRFAKFEDSLPAVLLPGNPLSVSCWVTTADALKNQLVRLRAKPGFDANAKLRVELNDVTVTNFVSGVPVSSFLPDANGVYDVGIQGSRLDSANAEYVLKLYAEDGLIEIDSFTFGNFGRVIKVPNNSGLIMIIR